jgi:hypothetical protein
MSVRTNFDSYRQGVYNQGAAIVAAYNNTASVTDKQAQLSAMDSLMQSFKAQSMMLEAQNPGDATWIDPRFHDFYDFFTNIANGWRSEIASMAGTSSAVGATAGQVMPSGCTAGICGPVPIDAQPSNQLVAVASGGTGGGGVTSVVTSGGGGSVANNLPLQAGGLAPSPYQSDLPGMGGASTLTPPSTGSSSQVLAAGIPGSFDFKTFFTGPMGLALAGGVIVILLLRNAKVSRG